MATTDYELEARIFKGRPGLKKQTQNLLCRAADAYKYMDRMFGRKKYVRNLDETTRILNEISIYLGSLEKTEEFIKVVKIVYPNWEDSYAIIESIIELSKD